MNRRNFLKAASMIPFSVPLVSSSNPLSRGIRTNSDAPNVLIVVFDALSASNVSLYGYCRETMPNLARFADRATVFHNHWAGGNFTTPGTSSIFTGTYPWTHRALNLGATTTKAFTSRNIFSEFGNSNYTRVGFSHNLWVTILLDSLKEHLEEFVLPHELAIIDYHLSDNLYKSDIGIAFEAEYRFLNKPGKMSNSVFSSPILASIKGFINKKLEEMYLEDYPRGLPGFHDIVYTLEDTIDWIMGKLEDWSQPFLSYLHMMPPHDPYHTRKEFVNRFWDSWQPPPKPDHFFVNYYGSQDELNAQRVFYDEYILYVDSEFGRLHDFLQDNAYYENTIVVFTSDHGEMFERKIWNHITPTLYEPIIRVPLLISIPNQTSRHDIFTPTSCVDVLPTLLYLTGRTIPEWCEGQILPPYLQQEARIDRSLFVVEAKQNAKMQPLQTATFALRKGDYKLVYYRGYEGYDNVFELFNLKEDPDELENLFESRIDLFSELKQELLQNIEEKDKAFLKT
jgi:arylsulfatase A-like enzyme